MNVYEKYLGIPWEEGGRGPDSFDCAGFTRMVQKEHFGIDMPVVFIPDYDDTKALISLLRGHDENNKWVQVQTPMDGDLVIIRKPLHVGTWVAVDGGGVLHCPRGNGVKFSLDSTWNVVLHGRKEFYRHRSKI